MSISNSLANAISGMNAASRQAEVVSSNVSNALTDGYGRRSVELSAQVVGGRGAGVSIGQVVRHVDRGILADRRMADSAMGEFETLVSMMGRIEDTIGSIGQEGSISSRIVDVESALVDAASDPSSSIRLSSLAGRLTDLTDSLQAASTGIQSLRAEADVSISDQVDQLNAALLNVQELNADITRALTSRGDPSALMDARQRAIDEIARIVPVRELDREHGQVALMTPSGQLLVDGSAQQFEFVANTTITADMTLASGGLSGLSIDGVPLTPAGIGKLDGGSLGAAFIARDVELVAAQDGLDTIAADLISRFQDPSVDPSLGVGQAGLLTDNGAAYDPLNFTGLAGRISLNASVDPDQGGILTNLRDGVAAVSVGSSGNATLLQAFSAALTDPLAIGSDPILQGAAGRASSVEARIGTQRLTYESELSFETARWSSLKEAEAAGGVDTDYEMQTLLRVEQAYAANARLIQTVQSMMQALMEI